MGVSGLLPLLKSIHKNTTLKKFAGQTIGIDGYGWLHRGAIACAVELALDKPTTKYIDWAVGRVRMLLDFGVTPYLVFDGDNLPSKAGTNEERRKKRQEAKALGLSLHKAGKMKLAYQELQKATAITPYMARMLIEELKKLNIQYIVAPYEADAQLVYLEQKGIIDGILSEDSDLLVFGAKRLLTKLDQYGECIEIERAEFPFCKEVSLAGWSDAMFRRMAILSGCDYLPNIDKVGLKTAYRFVRKYKDAERVIKMIAFEGKFSVPSDYLERFQQAELTFIHHRIFCPIQQKMVFLTELERGMKEEEMPYLGSYVEPHVAIGVACGDLNPKTKEPHPCPASKRPVFGDRRQTVGTPSDLKKRSSIDNFFRPNRTPLQELDPNSLTPSPSQQRLLQRHRNASWEPRMVSSAPQLRRISSATTPSSESLEHRAFLARASTLSNYQPPKRQRLCSENDEFSPSKEIKQSPFFSPKYSLASPLDQKKSRSRKSKPDFDVWSDDSVDDILLGLISSHNQTSAKTEETKRPETVIEADVCQPAELDVVPQSSPTQSFDESQGPQYSRTGTQTQLLVEKSSSFSKNTVTASISADEDPEAFEDLLEYHVRKQNEKIAKTFVLQSPNRQVSALESLSSPSKQVVASPVGKTSDLLADGSSTEEGTAGNCLDSRKSSPSPPAASMLLKTFAYQSLTAQESALQSLKRVESVVERKEITRASLASERRARISGRQSHVLENVFSSGRISAKPSNEQLRGSEDTLVPNSEDESSGGEDRAERPAVSLKSFVFTG